MGFQDKKIVNLKYFIKNPEMNFPNSLDDEKPNGEKDS